MCRASLWGVAGFLACSYFAWISLNHVLHDELDWPHDAWTAATYVVWIVLLVALTINTPCLRERLFFGVLVINFVVGFGLTLWASVQLTNVRMARLATGALWGLAALLSLTTIGRTGVVGSDKRSENRNP
jgi:hypothetical protein